MGKTIINKHEVYYKRCGKGHPLILLHGNTASGKMFNWEYKYYARYFDVIVPDFPGHGRSKPVGQLLSDYWYDNALAVIGLCQHLELEQAYVIGTSGGAQVALNMALEAPDLVTRVIADSFEGIAGTPEDAAVLKKLREQDGITAKLFYLSQHGLFWKRVVQKDTDIFYQFGINNQPYLHRDLKQIRCPVLITGSRKDDFINNIESRLKPVVEQIPLCQMVLFDHGTHPAMYSNRKQFTSLALDFLMDQ